MRGAATGRIVLPAGDGRRPLNRGSGRGTDPSPGSPYPQTSEERPTASWYLVGPFARGSHGTDRGPTPCFASSVKDIPCMVDSRQSRAEQRNGRGTPTAADPSPPGGRQGPPRGARLRPRPRAGPGSPAAVPGPLVPTRPPAPRLRPKNGDPPGGERDPASELCARAAPGLGPEPPLALVPRGRSPGPRVAALPVRVRPPPPRGGERTPGSRADVRPERLMTHKCLWGISRAALRPRPQGVRTCALRAGPRGR
jgi:hypothetical protein